MIENQLYRKLVGVKNFLDEIKIVDFYNQSCVLAIESYRRFIQFFIDHFVEIPKSSFQPLFVFISTQFVPSVRYIERALTSNIPWSIIPYLEKMLKERIGSEYLLLFRPQWHFNYSVMTDDLIEPLRQILIPIFRTRTSEIDGLFPKQKIHIFSFPYLEKTNVVLYSVIGHEIGHFYYNRWKNSPDTKKLNSDQRTHLLDHYRKQYPKDLYLPFEKANEGMNILEGLYREIVSDVCGYLIFGPSMLFSLNFISIFESKLSLPSLSNSYYPMTKYRIRILYEKMVTIDDKLHELLAGKSECVDYLLNYLNEIRDLLLNRDDKILHASILEEINLFEQSLPQVIAFAQSQIQEYPIKIENIPELFAKLDDTLPINELDGVPVSMPDIIFTGWIYSRKMDQTSSKEDYITEYQILMRLLLKSLFSSYVQLEYSQSQVQP